MAEVPAEVQRMFADLFHGAEKERRAREFTAAKADPVKHALTRVMDGGTGYTYFVAGERRLARKRFRTTICVARHRNAAGNFLIWRQVDTYTGREIVKNGRLAKTQKWRQAQRFDFKWSPSKTEAFDIARRWSARLLAEATPPQ